MAKVFIWLENRNKQMKAESLARVGGTESIEERRVKRVRRFLFFTTHWWEMVSVEHLHNDIHIETDRPIRAVWINGKEIVIDNK